MEHALENVGNLRACLVDITCDDDDIPDRFSFLIPGLFGFNDYKMSTVAMQNTMEVTGREGYFNGLCEGHFSEINMCYFLNEMPVSELDDRFLMFNSRMNKKLKLVNLQEYDIALTKLTELKEKLKKLCGCCSFCTNTLDYHYAFDELCSARFT